MHLSEISWERVQHPSEVLEVGQEVQVKIINIDREKKRIGLSIRALQNDPWQSKVEKFKVGQLVEGIITRLTKFGAFARLEGDLEGLIHISEISENRIEHPKEAGLHDGSVVTLRIIRIDPEQRRIGLSLRKVDSGAYKDLDLKQIDLEGVNLELVDREPEPGQEVQVEPVESKPEPVQDVELEPAESKPEPVEDVKPEPAESEPEPVEDVKPEPVDRKPEPVEDVKPEPVESEPEPDQDVKPEAVESEPEPEPDQAPPEDEKTDSEADQPPKDEVPPQE